MLDISSIVYSVENITQEYIFDSNESQKTYSVREVNEYISDVVSKSFDSEMWVKGEVQRLNFHSSGHIYFNLIESDRGRTSYTIPINFFKHNNSRFKGNLREILQEDREVRILVKPGFYAPYGKLSLHASKIDAEYTLGNLAIQRRALLEKLSNEGMLRANAQHEISELPLNIVLVTALDSAAYHDVTDQLKNSNIGFNIKVINALVQGNGSVESVKNALKKADTLSSDVVMLCRGGGSKSDLASFDSEKIARTICSMKTPVITGLGHQIDTSVADIVAHTSVKTPTACAQFLIERVTSSMEEMKEIVSLINKDVTNRLDDQNTRLIYISQRLSDTNHVLDKSSENLNTYKTEILRSIHSFLEIKQQKLENFSKLMTAHDPIRVLERGYSITYNSTGKLISCLDEVLEDEDIVTHFVDGTVSSQVKSKQKNGAN